MAKRVKQIEMIIIIFFLFNILLLYQPLGAKKRDIKKYSDNDIKKSVQELMKEGDIPGLTLVIVRPDQPDFVECFGYENIEKKIKVTPNTRFELASCSKSFTALAALQLEANGLLNLDSPISKYIPWFYLKYEGQKIQITVRHALHHITGIPTSTLKKIPTGNEKKALEQTVKNIVGFELTDFPGTKYQYATINYDIIGLVIEKVSGMTYENYMKTHIFHPLNLTQTSVGRTEKNLEKLPNISTGYKISFFEPKPYNAPPYRGNNPAGYIISNGTDMLKWLKLQMGLIETPLSPLIKKSQLRDELVPPNKFDMTSYAKGWQVSLSGNGEIRHSGLNPNFTSYVAFRPKQKIGVVVLANSNSFFTPYIGRNALNMSLGNKLDVNTKPEGGIDNSTSIFAIIMGVVIFIIFGYIIFLLIEVIKGKRKFDSFGISKLSKILLGLIALAPFLFAVYLLPMVMQNVTWKVALIWGPESFKTAVMLLLFSFGLGYFSYILSVLFPQTNKYLKNLPLLVLLSILSGLANAVIIFLISGSLFLNIKLIYMLYFFTLAMGLYLVGRKVVQSKLTKLTFDIVYDMRMQLIEKIFYTSYQKFEKIDRGRLFATLNNDTAQVGNSAGIFVTLLTSIITTVGVFLYLSTIAFWATLITLGIIISIATLYYFVMQKAQVYLEEARDTQNVYMELLNGLTDGFKELCLHIKKKFQYRDDLEKTTDNFRSKTYTGMLKFINAFMIGESMLIAVLGAVVFAVPRLFPNIQTFTLMSFIMALLYLIGPVNGILNSIPNIMQLKISWNRVKEFIKDVPANMKPEDVESLITDIKSVDSIEAKGVLFEYEKKEEEEESFALGPIDFKAQKGEILFVVGGNGSGKTTLAKLLTGLYIPDGGSIKVNGEEVSNYQLGEYFSTVFTGYHLFSKLYNIDLSNQDKREEGEKYLETLRLSEKVSLNEDSFSTTDLSGGQRKRLALLQCYLEDCPIFLFDEVAADQDPEFRRFFYRELLTKMKEKGKIVIAITHDDHYFDVADKVIKLDMGKVDVLTEGCQYMLSSGKN